MPNSVSYQIVRRNKTIQSALIKTVFLSKTSVHFVDVAAVLQWDQMNVFSERALGWVLAGHARFIFLLLSHLLPSLPSHLSAPQSAGSSVARTAHGARRGLGDVLAALRTTPGLRLPSVDGAVWKWSGLILQLILFFFFWKSAFGKLLKTF